MPSLPNRLTNNYTPRRSRLSTLIILLVWLAALGLLFINRQNLFDWWRLHDYKAPAAVAALAHQDTMTDYGRKVFYVNHPRLEAKKDFFDDCPTGNDAEQTIVLGCYHSGQGGIFLQDVTDPRLNGVEQVTAAHEMLHAAYERLSSDERARVNRLLTDYYENDLHDPRILKTIDAYKHTEPNDVVNEMHSVFGTEIANLPKPLEDYYKRYFTNRAKVSAFAARYQKAFSSRKALIDSYDHQRKALKMRIDDLAADLSAKQVSIEAVQRNLENKRRSGDIAGYNRGVVTYNTQVDAYNSELRQLKSLTNEYNAIVARINALATEQNQLVQELSNESQPINR
jgi:hypothetical protein